MDTLKYIVKLLLGLIAGSAIGLLIGGAAALLFTDADWHQLLHKFAQIDIIELCTLVVTAFLSAIAAGILAIILHEGGHLIFGLLTGYRFVSFRVFSLTLLRNDGHFRWKRFSLGGTGGQCLMRPPARPVEQIDTRWYNAGGVLVNLLTACISIGLYLYSTAPAEGSRLPAWLEMFCLISFIINIFIALFNGIPLRLGGIGNDGYNLFHLETRPTDKLLLYRMLEANALIQSGTQPKDLPAEWFPHPSTTDWADGLQANWQMMVLAHFENRHDWDTAYELLADAMDHRTKLLGLFQNELTAEMFFVCLATGRTDEARHYWTDDIATYVRKYAKTQSSKQRILFAKALLLDAGPASAHTLLDALKEREEQYLLQGEVAMDLELMQWLLA